MALILPAPRPRGREDQRPRLTETATRGRSAGDATGAGRVQGGSRPLPGHGTGRRSARRWRTGSEEEAGGAGGLPPGPLGPAPLRPHAGRTGWNGASVPAAVAGRERAAAFRLPCGSTNAPQMAPLLGG
jgi:hypothetical protein